MKTFLGWTRLPVAVLVAAAIGGLAAGIVLARGGTSGATVKGKPGVLARGSFRTISWGTAGTATVLRDTSGHLKLRFSHNFNTQRAPELFVYLVKYKGSRRTEWKQVASLQRAWGSQEYDLPSAATHDLGASVAIYCEKCNKIWGLAQLQPTGRAAA